MAVRGQADAITWMTPKEMTTELYEDFSMATPFERGVGDLARLFERWGLGKGAEAAARATDVRTTETYASDGERSNRATTVELDGRAYRVALFGDATAPPWPVPLEAAEADAGDFGPADDWSCLLDAARDDDARTTLRALFGAREALLVGAAARRRGYSAVAPFAATPRVPRG